MTSIPGIFRTPDRSRVRYLPIGGYMSVVRGVSRTALDIGVALELNRRTSYGPSARFGGSG